MIMKKTLSIFLVLSMLATAMASCSGETTEDTSAAGETTPAVEDTTPAAEETEPAAAETEAQATETKPAETEAPAVEAVANEGYIFERLSPWHVKAHESSWVDGDGNPQGSSNWLNGHYENDKFAEFVSANPEWYKDYELMAKWDELEAPFGDCVDEFIAGETEWISDKAGYQSLTVFKSFEITDISDTTLYEFYCFYDNSVHMYLNGVEFFVKDGWIEGDNSGNSDWNGGYDLITPNVDPEKTSIKDYLVEGTNYLVVSLRDKWGGREFDAELWYQLNSTKRDVTLLPTDSTWNAKAFSCPYTDGDGTIDGGAANGFFDEATDEFKKYITVENPGFTTDYATLESWPTFKANLNDSTADLGWVGGVHGLIAHTTFELTAAQLADVKTCDVWRAYGNYDNAIHMYLNGVEIYQHDGECVVQDWASGEFDLADWRTALEGALVEGTNHVVVTIKDAWGGRGMNMGLYCHWN